MHEHGLASSQLARLRDRGIPLTVIVDKVTSRIVVQRPGDKGGDRPGELCLNSDQVTELTQIVRSGA